jgi:hypothetical protein
MPCKQRPRVRLSPEQERRFEDFVATYERLGWRADAPSKRAWLEILQRLRKLIRIQEGHEWEALAIGELNASATKEPWLDVVLSINALRTFAGRLFPASKVEAQEEAVAFELFNHPFLVPVSSSGKANAFSAIRVANHASQAVGLTHRFHPIAVKKGEF